MASILKFNTDKEFYDHNYEHMVDNYYIYLQVLKYIPILVEKKAKVFAAFNITDENNNLIIGFHVSYNYYIFSNGWTPDMLELLAKEVHFDMHKPPYHFIGKKDLILELFKRNTNQWHVYKERLIYECYSVNNQYKKVKGDVQNASLYDIDELAEMTLAYSKEEYPEKEGDIEKAYGQAHHGITKKKMYVVKKGGIICSMLQVLIDFDSEDEKPIIGSLYTIPSARNKGYASLLLHTVTEGFLKQGFEVIGLLSDVTNPASNKAFLNVGYQPIYDWIDIVVD